MPPRATLAEDLKVGFYDRVKELMGIFDDIAKLKFWLKEAEAAIEKAIDDDLPATLPDS